MSKISEQKAFGLTKTFNWTEASLEQKALEAYPIDFISDDDTMGFTSSDRNEVIRLGYIKGYDQAMQDFMEKAEEFFYEQFNIHPHDFHVVQYVSDTPLENMDDFVEQFKNYMKDEM